MGTSLNHYDRPTVEAGGHAHAQNVGGAGFLVHLRDVVRALAGAGLQAKRCSGLSVFDETPASPLRP
ncbi:hypothetical protein GGQ85_003093 [Nitrobacter vulgaris]|jgi:hypothetical protein|uniref:Uncharacterized protein n=1 Tax=Nitrobacter vulgaris TaxID=29421 RepID=A0A1V4I0S9_NITVU|nr:hypothetical protein [Nitrobacter vulgaris]OPH83836.1 hypothetical protein B2M20_04820 [Nitrobacter vulgaris]